MFRDIEENERGYAVLGVFGTLFGAASLLVGALLAVEPGGGAAAVAFLAVGGIGVPLAVSMLVAVGRLWRRRARAGVEIIPDKALWARAFFSPTYRMRALLRR